MSQVYYLTYISRMTLKAGLSAKTLGDINSVARRENPPHNVTGFLCFGNGFFFQYIEGDQQDIQQLFSNIQRDNRNRHVTVVSEGYQDNRLFEDWKMLMVNINNPDTDIDIIDIFTAMKPGTTKHAQADKLIKIMQSQYDRRSIIDFDSYSEKNISHYGVSMRALLKAHQEFLMVQAALLLLIIGSLARLK